MSLHMSMQTQLLAHHFCTIRSCHGMCCYIVCEILHSRWNQGLYADTAGTLTKHA